MSRSTALIAWLALVLALAAPALGGKDNCVAASTGEPVPAFAHGYLHGYEAGFHAGDTDFHSGRVRGVDELREANRPLGYQPEFGSRGSFSAGFREGFTAGYQDSVAGHDFRGLQIMAASTQPGVLRSRYFDVGFEDGYKAGRQLGARDADADADFDPQQRTCPLAAERNEASANFFPAYCSGYLSSYPVGYTDGYLVTAPVPDNAVVAAK